MAALSAADLTALGYRVVDGRAVRVGSNVSQSASGRAVGEAARSAVDDPMRGSTSAGSVAVPQYRSKWEAERAEKLEICKRAGTIRDWQYQGIRLRLADGAWYKPDFVVWRRDGSIELEEVKGFFREAAKVRWKVAIDRFPMFAFSLITKQGGLWMAIEHHEVAG